MIEVKNNFYIRICLLWSIIFLSAMMGQAQEMFHRIYPSQNNKNVLSLKSIQAKNGSYLALHIELEEPVNEDDDPFGDTLIITNFKPKGDVNWSKSIALSGKYKSFNPQLSSLVQGQNDSIYYSVVALDDNLPVNLTGSLDINGNLGFLKATGVAANVSDNTGESNLLVNYNKALFNAYGAVAGNEQSIHLSKKNYNGNISWVKSLGTTVNNANVPESLLGFEFADDTTFIMTGLLDSLVPKPFIAVLDTVGNPLMSKMFTDADFDLSIPLSYNAHKFSNGTYVLTGYLLEVSFPFNIDIKGFIIKTDAQGNVTWSKKVVVNDGDFTVVKHSIVDRDNNIVVAGSNFSFLNQETYPFLAKIDQSGKILWKKKYDRTDSSLDFTGSLYQTRDQGYVYYTTCSKDGLTVPSLIKTSIDGTTGCESDMDEALLVDNIFTSDTLVWSVVNITNVTEDIVVKTKAHNFKVPVLSLAVRPFCPNEPIDWTFDASVQGATSYLWNDNSTADTLRVFKEGEYSVMVKIDEDVCYTLCDTAKLERYTKPQAQINLSLGNFCTNGKQTLSLSYNPGHPQVKSVTWSTGETGVTSIEIATPGTYRVTVVDQCDETATALINVGPFPQKLSAATITGDPSVNCIRGTISGLLTATGNAVGLGDLKYLWSTGATTAVISLNDSEVLTYTVTVTDVCGTSATANKVVELKGSNNINANITLDESKKCEGVVVLNVITGQFSPNLKYAWSNGASTPNINVTSSGNYTVTVTDVCGNSASAVRNVKIRDSELKISINDKLDCINGKVTLSVSSNSPITKYSWSNGVTTDILSLNKGESNDKTFTVTVTDDCGVSATSSFTVKFVLNSNFFLIDTIGLARPCNSLTLIVNKGAFQDTSYNYNWSNGSKTRRTTIINNGTYTVTITGNECSGSVVKDININIDSFGINDLIYAKIFFPDGTFTPGQMIDSTTLKSEDYKNAEQYNRTFGPVNQRKYCIPDITEYELHVFNRWGQEVFVSDDIFKEWDGTYQDQQAPTESYLWIAKYKIFGIEKTVKGSVTMIRR